MFSPVSVNHNMQWTHIYTMKTYVRMHTKNVAYDLAVHNMHSIGHNFQQLNDILHSTANQSNHLVICCHKSAIPYRFRNAILVLLWITCSIWIRTLCCTMWYWNSVWSSCYSTMVSIMHLKTNTFHHIIKSNAMKLKGAFLQN